MLSLRKITHGFGGAPLLDDVSFEIRPRERLCLVGRNGSGKSTLLKILSGSLRADSIEIEKPAGYRMATLPQEVPTDRSGPVRLILEEALVNLGLADWEIDHAIEMTATSIQIDPEAEFSSLSAGMKRRVILGQATVSNPDLLLLDEPTNHLDVDSIEWLESFLLSFTGSLLFVTHDRAFLQKMATSILDLDRGKLTRWDGDYTNYLRRKQEFLDAETKQRALFDKKLAEEEVWIRKGIQARRTRNEGRVRALLKMREAHRARRARQGQVRLDVANASRSGVQVITAEDVSFEYPDSAERQIRDCSVEIERGDRIGIVGPNGSGKTTLLNLLLGKLIPQSGTIRQGTQLQIAYFDQLRDQLDEQATVQHNIADGADFVEVNGQRRHVIGYLQDFLFTPDRARSPVSMLSGGERNRLLLARLFTRPCNLLVMDEPTNDLDLETLDLLEECLADFSGTLLMVSHDRAFLNNVVTELLILDGKGNVETFVGGYDDYAKRKAVAANAPAVARSAGTSAKTDLPVNSGKPRKFLNRERRELEELPGQIEQLENEQANLVNEMADAAIFQKSPELIEKKQSRLDAIEAELLVKFARWEKLEVLRSELG